MLYLVLRRRGHFQIDLPLWGRLARQLMASLAMAATLLAVKYELGGLFDGSAGDRLIGIGALVGSGGIVYFGVAWAIGAFAPERSEERRGGKAWVSTGRTR